MNNNQKHTTMKKLVSIIIFCLVTVFAQKGAQILHRRGLDGLETKAFEDIFDSVEDIISAHHDFRQEVAGTFGYAGFLCHSWNFLQK